MAKIDDVTPDFIADISASVILALTKSGEILYYNRNAGSIFFDIAVGKNIEDIIPHDDAVIWHHNMDIVFFSAEHLDFYWFFRSRFYQVSAHLFAEKIFFCLQDITEIRIQHNLLSDCSARFSGIERLAEIGYWELNLPQKKIYWSEGMYKICALKDDTAKHRKNLLRHYIHPDDYEIYRQKLRALLSAGQNIDVIIRIIDASGNTKRCYFKAFKTYFHGDAGACGIFQLINTDINNIQLLHDVKQHLQAIMSFADSLKDGDRNNIAEQIIYHCQTAASVLNDAREKTDTKEINLFAALKEVCREFQNLSVVKNIKFICRLQNIRNRTDTSLILPIVRNLLDNAFKFTSNKVILSGNDTGIWIIDNGCGLSNEGTAITNNLAWGEGHNIINHNVAAGNFRLLHKSRRGKYTIFRLLYNFTCQS